MVEVAGSSMVGGEIHEGGKSRKSEASTSVHRAGRAQIRVSINRTGLKFHGCRRLYACLSPSRPKALPAVSQLLPMHADSADSCRLRSWEDSNQRLQFKPRRIGQSPNDLRHESSGGARNPVGCFVVVGRRILDDGADTTACHKFNVVRSNFLREEKRPSLLRREPPPICLVTVAAIVPQNPPTLRHGASSGPARHHHP